MPRTYRKLTAAQKKANRAVAKSAKLAPPRPPGRPKKIIPPADGERLAMLGCTDGEIAIGLAISLPTFRARMKDDPEFAAAIERGKAQGKIKLRMLMVQHSEGEGGPAVNMTIHRAKHELGQFDKPVDTKHTVDVNIDISGSAERFISKLDGLRQRLLESQSLPQLEVLETVAEADGEFVVDGSAGGAPAGGTGRVQEGDVPE